MSSEQKIYVKDLADHERVISPFLVIRKVLAATRSGNDYLIMTLADHTGQVESRIWENARKADQDFDAGDVLTVRGRIQRFQGKLQLICDDYRRQSLQEVDPDDFLPRSAFDIQELYARYKARVSALASPYRELMESILSISGMTKLLSRTPAARSLHHAYLGGLLEHSLSVAALVKSLTEHYERYYPGLVDRDLAVTGALLHDIGKIREYEVAATVEFTDRGRFVGHIVEGVSMVRDAIRGLDDFPAEARMQVEHLIVSHHGQLEYGSPKQPVMAEAILVHEADLIDSRMNMLHQFFLNEGERWTSFHRKLSESFWNPYVARKDAALADEIPMEEATPPTPAVQGGNTVVFTDEPESNAAEKPADKSGKAVDNAKSSETPPEEPDEEGPGNLDLF